jgi:hypothetical protein
MREWEGQMLGTQLKHQYGYHWGKRGALVTQQLLF